MQVDALIRRPEEVLRESGVPEPVLLQNIRELRRMTREEMVEQINEKLTEKGERPIKLNYYRHIENGAIPAQVVKGAIREVLSECPIHRALQVRCAHKLPVPPDDELYAPAQR